MNEIRARVIIQERGFCKIASEYGEKWAEVSGKFRHEAGAAADFPAVGDYCLALWPEDESHNHNAISKAQLFFKKSGRKGQTGAGSGGKH